MLRDALLAPLDIVRGIPSLLGMRLYSVTVRVTRWAAGERIGQGARSVTDTQLFVNTNKNPRVKQLSAKETVAQGNAYQDQLFEIGPVTPEIIATATINPPMSALDRQEVHYIITGPGLPASGALCEKISDSLVSPFRYMLTVRRIGVNK